MPTEHTAKKPRAKRKGPRAPAKTQAHSSSAPVAGDAVKASPRRRRRRKRVRIGDALRREGLDEHAVAKTYAQRVEKLKNKSNSDLGTEKLLVDIMKECSRHLESSRPTERSGAGDTPVTVQLVHAVPRPERPATKEGKAEVASG
jgi:hypothetical protein